MLCLWLLHSDLAPFDPRVMCTNPGVGYTIFTDSLSVYPLQLSLTMLTIISVLVKYVVSCVPEHYSSTKTLDVYGKTGFRVGFTKIQNTDLS